MGAELPRLVKIGAGSGVEGVTEIPISWPVGRNTSGDLGLEVGAVLWP